MPFQTSFLSLGVRDIQLFDIGLDMLSKGRPFEPRYFALKCSSTAGVFSSVNVDSFKHFKHYVEAKYNIATDPICSIPGCEKLEVEGVGATPDTCGCAKCQDGFVLIPADAPESPYDKCLKSEWMIQVTSVSERVASQWGKGAFDTNEIDWTKPFMPSGDCGPSTDSNNQHDCV